MADEQKPPITHPNPKNPKDDMVEQDPAVEWGERIDTSKQIARGGKTTGHVPGANEEKPKEP